MQRLPKNLYSQMEQVVGDILKLRLDHLDIKKMKGFENRYRCRVGKFRIVFEKKEDFGDILDMDTRGDIY
ncbi:MAG: type II toxin-antitoxin system RelE/ParE family toxin [Candidatus Peregrinibacteria bacterium]